MYQLFYTYSDWDLYHSLLPVKLRIQGTIFIIVVLLLRVLRLCFNGNFVRSGWRQFEWNASHSAFFLPFLFVPRTHSINEHDENNTKNYSSTHSYKNERWWEITGKTQSWHDTIIKKLRFKQLITKNIYNSTVRTSWQRNMALNSGNMHVTCDLVGLVKLLPFQSKWAEILWLKITLQYCNGACLVQTIISEWLLTGTTKKNFT